MSDAGPQASPIVGWVLAYGSLVDPDDPLVRRLAATGRAVPGTVAGMRRTWTAGMENRAPENDGKHYVEKDGGRPDVVVVTLSADDDPAVALPVLALPVDAEGLARTDAREARYDRVAVGERFSVPLAGPVWIYRATTVARERTAEAAAAGRAVVSAGYVDRVERAFRARGVDPWRAYRASTDEPPHPRLDLRLRYGPDADGSPPDPEVLVDAAARPAPPRDVFEAAAPSAPPQDGDLAGPQPRGGRGPRSRSSTSRRRKSP